MSPKRIAKLLAVFGIVALGAILVVTIGVVRKRSPARNLSQIAGLVPGALLHARNFHWTQMKGAVKEWELNAREASFSNDRKSLTLKDVKLSLLAADGRQVGLEAPLAKLRVDGNLVKEADLSGGLTVHYGDFLLTTERAIFLPGSDELEAPGTVTVVGQGIKVTGTGLTGRPREQQFTLGKAVSTEIIPGSGGVDSKKL